MCNEDIGDTQIILQLLEQVQDLGLNRDIQGGDWFVADDQFRLACKCTGNSNPLTLPTGELVGKAFCVLASETNAFQKFM